MVSTSIFYLLSLFIWINIYTSTADDISVSTTTAYNWQVGNASVWLSAAAYCETNTYKTMSFHSYASGFEVKYALDYSDSDTQGFIGIMPSQSQIYMVYRGSESLEDWLVDLDNFSMSTYNPVAKTCTDCSVHNGFYGAYLKNKDDIISKLKTVMSQYPTYKVIISGHSLGAALSTLLSLELSLLSIDVTLYNFGSPRVGNENWAVFASTYITDRNRVTHHKDIVVHVPLDNSVVSRFMHISNEWYLVKQDLSHCSGYEDESCSYQWNITSISDHTCYFDFVMNCDGPTGASTCVSS